MAFKAACVGSIPATLVSCDLYLHDQTSRLLKKNNLLTDINLYLDGHQPSAHYKPARTDSQRRLTPQLRTQLIRTKHQVKRTQNRLFLSKYRRLQFTRQAQRRVLAGSTARLISPYRRFFKRGE